MIYRQSVLDRISSPEDLDELMQVTSPRTWLALLALALLLLAGLIWSTLTSLTTTVSAEGVIPPPGQEALVFVTPAKAGQVHPGMTARVTAPVVINGVALSLSGRVASVGQSPLDAPALARVLGNTASASLLASNGPLIPVRVAFLQVPHVPGSATHRTPCQASITVSSQRLIHLIVP